MGLHDNSDMEELAQPEKDLLKNLCRAYVSGLAMEGLGDLNPNEDELYGENGEYQRCQVHRIIENTLNIEHQSRTNHTEEGMKLQQILHNVTVYCETAPSKLEGANSMTINKVGKELADMLEEKFVGDN